MSEITTNAKSADREPNGAKTPTVRGFFRRGAWKQRLDACGLPAETRGLVASTVHATKLRPAEKLAVADELIAHFHDADRQGVEPAAARAAFGEPAVAAKLIRRAKKRNRGSFSKLKTCVSWGIGAFVVFYAVLAIRFYSGEPTVKVNFVNQLDAAAAAPLGASHAWPALKLAIDALAPLGEVANTAARDSDADWGLAVAGWVSGRPGELQAVRDATAATALGMPIQAEGDAGEPPRVVDLFSAFGMRLTGFRMVGRALEAEASLAAAAGDATRASENIHAILRLAHLTGQPTLLIHGLVASSLSGLARHSLERVLAEQPGLFTEAQLAALQHAFAGAPSFQPHNLHGERQLFHDVLQRTHTDDGRGGGRITPAGVLYLSAIMAPVSPDGESGRGVDPATPRLQRLLAPASLLMDPGRGPLAELHAAAVEATLKDLRRPLWLEGPTHLEDVLEPYEASVALRARYFTALAMVQAFRILPKTVTRGRASNAGAVLALALHRHRLATGSFPDPDTGYADLIPAYLDATPLDPLHGTPLRWTIRDGQPLIYSLGADGDDDGGVPPTDDLGGNDAAFAPPEEAVNGDWIAWPPSGVKPCSPCP